MVDGFYKWGHEQGKKYPYLIQLASGDAFALAGIWDSWNNDETGESLRTFSVITTQANSLLEKIHNIKKRMPVILERSDEKTWLKPGLTQDQIEPIMKPYDAAEMKAHTASRTIARQGFNITNPSVIDEYLYHRIIWSLTL